MNNTLKNAPETIIFDCDGVLIDSWDSTMYFYNKLKKSLGLAPLTREEQEYVWVATIREGVERVIPEELREKAWETIGVVDWSEIVELVKLEHGLPEFLAYLNGAGIKAAVNTNGGSEAPQTLDTLGIFKWFQLVVTADDVTRPKPDAEGALKIMKTLGSEPSRTVFIGDSAVDQKTARAAAVGFWAYNNPSLEADYHVSSFLELKKALEAIRK